MKATLLLAMSALLLASTASSQTMDHAMHGMTMPAAPKPVAKVPAKPASKVPAKPAAAAAAVHQGHDMPGMTMDVPTVPKAPDPHAGHDMSSMPGMSSGGTSGDDPHAGHDMPGMQTPAGEPMQHDMGPMPGMAMGSPLAKVGTDLPPGSAPAPAAARDHLADRHWDPSAMAASRRDDLGREHGGQTFYQILFNLAEYQARKGADGYRWDGEAWVGGDINRLTLKSEGEGSFGKPLEQAEVQALYSRALDPYWNLQAGIRYDFTPNPSRTYATIGFEGLAPYWFDVEGALFLSNKGDVLGRAEAWYDQRLTQTFVLQPRVEANFSAQDVRETGLGSGLTDLELGLRLRYDRSREFAPYVGVSWERQFGDTARFTRARGDDTGGFSFVAGVRMWF